MKQILSAVIISLSLFGCQSHERADQVLYNGRIFTLDSAFSVVEAIAIRDGKVIDTGSSHDIRSRYRATLNEDLEKRVVYPAFNDAHAHFFGYAMSLNYVNLKGARSWDEVLTRVQAYAKENRPAYIDGRGWDQNLWPDQSFPDRSKLDELFPEIPVRLRRIDGHASLVNGAALHMANITADTQVEGGVVEKRNGRLTGLLIDKAEGLVRLPEPERERQITLLLRAQDSLLKYGITSVTDAGLNRRQIALLQELQEEERLFLRINAMVSDEASHYDHFLSRGPVENEQLRVQCFKIYLDGALGSRGALLLEPYADDSTENYGLQQLSSDSLRQRLQRLKKAGWQVAIHAIGDSANRLVLNLYEELWGDTAYDHRWRVEHAQIVQPEDVARFGNLGAIPSVQPTHATSDMNWAQDRLGPGRMKAAYPYRSLYESAGLLPMGTDFPVEEIDPRKTFAAAVFRQDAQQYPEGGFRPEERLSREEALRGMTEWPAFAAFEESYKGRLVPGHLADFVVLRVDWLKATAPEIRNISIDATYLAGKKRYQHAVNVK